MCLSGAMEKNVPAFRIDILGFKHESLLWTRLEVDRDVIAEDVTGQVLRAGLDVVDSPLDRFLHRVQTVLRGSFPVWMMRHHQDRETFVTREFPATPIEKCFTRNDQVTL